MLSVEPELFILTGWETGLFVFTGPPKDSLCCVDDDRVVEARLVAEAAVRGDAPSIDGRLEGRLTPVKKGCSRTALIDAKRLDGL